MITTFNVRTADDLWQQLTDVFATRRGVSRQPSRAGETHELLHVGISIEEPTQRWMAIRNPPINLAFALAEVVWILAGRNDSAFLNYFNSKLPEFAGQCNAYHGAYGHRLRTHFGIDQIERAYEILSSKAHSRQVVLQIWDVKNDIPGPAGDERSADIPCNVLSLLKLRHGKLEWTQIMRSNDLFRGLPYNIVQFTTLQEIIAGWLQVELGSYNHLSDSLHVYDEDLRNVELLQAPTMPIRNCDRLVSLKAESEKHISTIAEQVERIIDVRYGAEELLKMTFELKLPTSFRNIVLVLTAEGARRRKAPQVVQELIEACSNPLFRQLYGKWLLRTSSRSPNSVEAR